MSTCAWSDCWGIICGCGGSVVKNTTESFGIIYIGCWTSNTSFMKRIPTITSWTAHTLYTIPKSTTASWISNHNASECCQIVHVVLRTFHAFLLVNVITKIAKTLLTSERSQVPVAWEHAWHALSAIEEFVESFAALFGGHKCACIVIRGGACVSIVDNSEYSQTFVNFLIKCSANRAGKTFLSLVVPIGILRASNTCPSTWAEVIAR